MDHEPDVHRRDNENGVSEGPFEDVIQIHDNEDPCEEAELDDDYDRELDEFNHGMVRVWDEDSDNDDDGQARTNQPGSIVPPLQLTGERRRRKREFPSMSNWWRTLLIGSAEPGTLSTGHVAMNMFSSSLHPGVLLAIPVYFSKTDVVPGMLILTLVALLSIFGGGLWVSLGRYVGGSTIESITSKAFGMNTRWKKNIGHAISSIALVVYCTGAAVIAYHAMTDLLIQVFMHYTIRGQIFHDRAFVTLAVGGFLTLPLLLTTTPKRNMFQIQSWTVLLFYPAIIGILLMRINEWTITGLRKGSRNLSGEESMVLVPQPYLPDNSWPWASTAMLPLLVLSASPVQVLAHSRSLRRKTAYDSNVMAFFFAQLCQVILMLLVTYVLGVDVGLIGSSKLSAGLHANFFNAFPLDDNYINAARALFILLLAAHLTVCLASARSCWSRFFKLLNLHPLRNMTPPTPHIIRQQANAQTRPSAPQMFSPAWLPSSWHSPLVRQMNNVPQDVQVWQRVKSLQDKLAAIILWSITAFPAYFSGVGGVFRRNEKEGEELRFLRSLEYIGILGAVVGFILPALNWLVLFKIRRPRAILLLQSNSMRRRISRFLLSPLSTLIGKTSYASEDTEPLLSENSENPPLDDHGHPCHPMSISIPNHTNEHSSNNCDDATLILLARKECELQRKSRRRRRWQEFLVVLFLVPFGLLLIAAAFIELLQGGY